MSIDMSINGLQKAFASNILTPAVLMQSIREKAASLSEHNIWVHLSS